MADTTINIKLSTMDLCILIAALCHYRANTESTIAKNKSHELIDALLMAGESLTEAPF